MVERVVVCPASALPPGSRRIVEVDGLPHAVGVFNVDGEYYALANVCPHHLAPLCEGEITGEMVAERVGEYELIREGEIIQCPWHGWKFDIIDGTSVFNPHALRTRTYEARVESDAEDADAESSDSNDSTVTDEEPYGTALRGDEPPIETYDVERESEFVVLYVP